MINTRYYKNRLHKLTTNNIDNQKNKYINK